MENPKFKFLKQWFTFTFNDDNNVTLSNVSNVEFIIDAPDTNNCELIDVVPDTSKLLFNIVLTFDIFVELVFN